MAAACWVGLLRRRVVWRPRHWIERIGLGVTWTERAVKALWQGHDNCDRRGGIVGGMPWELGELGELVVWLGIWGFGVDMLLEY